MDDLFIKSVAYIKEKLQATNKTSRSDPESANFLLDHQEYILHLFGQSRVSLRTIKNLKNAKKRVEHNYFLIKTCELKQKKLKEKDLVHKKLKTELSMIENNQITNSSLITFEASKLSNPEDTKINPFYELCQTTSEKSKYCYVCKKIVKEIHFFYDKLCFDCGCFNYAKRTQSCDFSGFVAVVTGCRIKIGYEICLFLLRNSCFVIGTTRFAKECFLRYKKEPDFEEFKNRLKIYSLDLRDLNGLQQFVGYLYGNYEKIDILINNAAQTLRRNVKFYESVMNIERNFLEFNSTDAELMIVPTKQLIIEDGSQNLALAAYSSQIQLLPSDFSPNLNDFPQNVLDKDGQQVDLSKKSS